ncbi:MAG TPA: enoyl-CoA hydratase/isomerase family protein [Hyphomicrobiaceae bacterium]|nr:enoyl-CoA hydratase/isomerase family protein [Hyphomicrobiaceae bacterium]
MPRTDIAVPKALTVDAVADICAKVHGAISDSDTSAVILRGDSGAFCNGLDFRSFLALEKESVGTPATEDVTKHAIESFAACLTALRYSGKPTIALVDGTAQGGGLGLVAACDIVVATDRSSFALPELLYGLSPAVVLPFLLERMPRQTVRTWALSGDSQSGQCAREARLVDELVPEADLERAGARWVRCLERAEPTAAKRLRETIGQISPPYSAEISKAVEATAMALADEGIRRTAREFLENGIVPWLTRS